MHRQGMKQDPNGKGRDFASEFFSRHTPVKGNDYVFTHPARLP
jgi:hypothetical protein